MPTIPLKKLAYVKKRYYADGWSALDIARDLGVGIRAVYNFMRRQRWSRRSHTESNRMAFLKKPSTFKISEQLAPRQERLRIIAAALYWSEGAKRGRIVDFANSDIDMCKIFVKFLREVCHVDEKKLRGYIYCHEGKNTKQLIEFWSKALKIPTDQFTQPYVRKGVIRSKNKYPDRMSNGLVHIRYGDLKLLDQIKQWINELALTQ